MADFFTAGNLGRKVSSGKVFRRQLCAAETQVNDEQSFNSGHPSGLGSRLCSAWAWLEREYFAEAVFSATRASNFHAKFFARVLVPAAPTHL